MTGAPNTDFDFIIGSWRVMHRRLRERLAGCEEWLDGRNPGALDTPVVGQFREGVGTFYADDVLNGRPIRIRFTWSVPATGNPRWEQAFSNDAGQSWETNWTMDFIRAQPC